MRALGQTRELEGESVDPLTGGKLDEAIDGRRSMNELSGRVLMLFGQPGKESLDLHTLFEAAGNDPTERQLVLDAVEDLVRSGMLDAKSGDFYALTDKGREEVNRA
jgi:hypothetical protein